MNHPYRSKERGQTAIMFTLGTITMFGMLGLVVDIGYAYFRKEAAQAAAEAAATAAVKAALSQTAGGSITCGANNVVCQAETSCPASISGTGNNNVEKGCLYAQANGYTTAGRLKVTIEAGSGTVNGVKVGYYVVAKASERLPQLFSAVTGNMNATYTARSVVGYIAPSSTAGCVYVLNPNAASLQMNGNTALNTGCGVYVNSTNSSAITLKGNNASITATGGAGVSVGGGINYGPNVNSISPTPQLNQPSAGDPLAGLDPPADGTCKSGVTVNNNQKVTINPGTYCGDIDVRGGGQLTLNPGLYIIKGSTTGGLSVGGQATISGSGVTLYFETGSVSFAGGATSNLSAPSSGTWSGVLMYQDRANTQTASLVGGTSQITSGILYFPSASLSYTGGSSTTSQSTTIIADTLNLVGNSTIQAAASSPYLNSATGVLVLE